MYFCVLPSLLFLGRWVFSRSRSVKWKLVPTWPVFFYNFRFDFFQNFPSWIFHFILWLVAQTRHYSFLSLFYLSIICSSCPTYLFSLSVGGGTRRTHSQKFNLKKKKTMHKKKIPNRNWKITLRMWMRGGRKVKRKSLISPPPNYSFCTQSPATLFPTIRSTRFCFVWFFLNVPTNPVVEKLFNIFFVVLIWNIWLFSSHGQFLRYGQRSWEPHHREQRTFGDQVKLNWNEWIGP